MEDTIITSYEYSHGFNAIKSKIIDMPDVAIYTLLTLIITYGLYYYFFTPLNRIRNDGDVGYPYLEGEAKKRGRELKDYVRYMRSLQKIGQVPPVFPNGWYAILESQDISKGEVKSVTALGETFAVLRSNDGEVYVLDAFCPHLGANLGAGGKLYGSCVECPFHGWLFDGKNGECVKVPYSDKVPPHSNVKKWISEEKTGSIYIWYHAENEEPTWPLPDVPEIDTGDWYYRGRSEHSFTAHIQDVTENASDVAHFSQVHGPSMLAGVDLGTTRTNSFWKFATHTWNASWKEGEEPITHTACLSLIHKMCIFEKIPLFTADVRAVLYGPGIVHLNMHFGGGKCVFIQTVLPISPLEMRMVHQLYATVYMPTPYANLVLYGESIMIERDMMVWTNKKFLSKPILVKEDRYLIRHRRWFSQFYSENSPQISCIKNGYNW